VKSTDTSRVKLAPSFSSDPLYLVEGMRFPSRIDRFVKALGEPDRVEMPVAEDPTPVGQIYQWGRDYVTLNVIADDYSPSKINPRAEVRAAYILGNGHRMRSLYDTVIGVDRYADVYRKIVQYLERVGADKRLIEEAGSEYTEYPQMIRLQDPKTGYYNVFYFRYGILDKVAQGTFDLSRAG
jgi:hypothetical protein